ncbi:MAG: LolA-like putative outer membrane lipoprotein chaperone [Prevotella sp.]
MKRLLFIVSLLGITSLLYAQDTKKILDKAASAVNQKSGMKASFSISGGTYNGTSGTIAIKGRKFQITTPQMIIWFNGSELWSYVKSNEEVSVTHPNDAQLNRINPYSFITMYRSGYTLSHEKKGGNYIAHLQAQSKNSRIQEVYITINETTCLPSVVRLCEKGVWSTIQLSKIQSVKLADSVFQFNAKEHPNAEVIDLR